MKQPIFLAFCIFSVFRLHADFKANSIPLVDFKHEKKTPGLVKSGQRFRSGHVLVKFRGDSKPSVLPVRISQELEFVERLRKDPGVEFAELDLILETQHQPNDPLLSLQWHHSTIGSFGAWEFLPKTSEIKIAMVDPPFQMSHPDLSANTIAGWDIIDDVPITSSTGAVHSTLQAGIAAAVINNSLGVAGVSRCKVLPINVNGAISEIAQAIYWAASNDIRVVSISWTGAHSETIEDAARFHKSETSGLVAMAGVNGSGFLDYPNRTNIYCISMTDAADNIRSRHGNHIDFAAPGWEIYSTTINSSYNTASGTSYSTPLFAGVVAALFSINPLLQTDEIVEILKNTASDLGAPGWDQYFGWGRINFGAAAAAVNSTRPRIVSITHLGQEIVIEAPYIPNTQPLLLSSPDFSQWEPVSPLQTTTNNSTVTFSVPVGGSATWFKLQYSRLPPPN